MTESSPQMDTSRPLAVVLLSGGLDSATALAIATDQGFACHCVSFDYGQRHTRELTLAAEQARLQDALSHRVVRLDPAAFAASALTSGAGDVPKGRSDEAISSGIPSTYVPARNTVFLSYALGLAEVLGARAIFLGVNAVDYSGYPDCRPDYIAAFERLANLATREGAEHDEPWFRIHAPLIDLTKRGIIEAGLALGVDYGQTSTCYDPVDDHPCGSCDACHIRLKAFADMGMEDPATKA